MLVSKTVNSSPVRKKQDLTMDSLHEAGVGKLSRSQVNMSIVALNASAKVFSDRQWLDRTRVARTEDLNFGLQQARASQLAKTGPSVALVHKCHESRGGVLGSFLLRSHCAHRSSSASARAPKEPGLSCSLSAWTAYLLHPSPSSLLTLADSTCSCTFTHARYTSFCGGRIPGLLLGWVSDPLLHTHGPSASSLLHQLPPIAVVNEQVLRILDPRTMLKAEESRSCSEARQKHIQHADGMLAVRGREQGHPRQEVVCSTFPMDSVRGSSHGQRAPSKRKSRSAYFTSKAIVLSILVSAAPVAMAQNCVSLAGSTSCPAFTNASVSTSGSVQSL